MARPRLGRSLALRFRHHLPFPLAFPADALNYLSAQPPQMHGRFFWLALAWDSKLHRGLLNVERKRLVAVAALSGNVAALALERGGRGDDVDRERSEAERGEQVL